MTGTNLDELIKSSRSMWWKDGIAEFITGIVLILSGGLQFLLSGSPRPAYRYVIVAAQILVIALSPYAIRWLKNRLVVPITGYFKPQKQDKGTSGAIRYAISIALFILLTATILIDNIPPWLSISAFSFIILLWVGIFWNVNRLIFEGILLAAVPPAVTLTGNSTNCIPISLIIMGAIMVTIGGVVSYRFMREHRKNE